VAAAAEVAAAPGRGAANGDILRRGRTTGTLREIDDRDVTILLEAVFDIRRDVQELLGMFREDDDDGQEEDRES
jgi:hypothetical protein